MSSLISPIISLRFTLLLSIKSTLCPVSYMLITELCSSLCLNMMSVVGCSWHKSSITGSPPIMLSVDGWMDGLGLPCQKKIVFFFFDKSYPIIDFFKVSTFLGCRSPVCKSEKFSYRFIQNSIIIIILVTSISLTISVKVFLSRVGEARAVILK